jgi:signal transduction histidine kinase/CheY-like chemotaxis protein/purine-cytosine permease-like protein
MSGQQRIVRIRRQYNQWVANQTLEDYALRFTAKRARKWSNFHVANTALGAISFLACEAIGATITLNYGFDNAMAATLAVSLLIFATGLPIAYYAVKNGVDIDLLTRGAGFGYIGSTVTSLVYASFTFIFFAIEAAIMSMALEMCFGVPLPIAYLVCSLLVIPIVAHGIKLISWLQMWTQPVWLILQCLPLAVIAIVSRSSVGAWTKFAGLAGTAHGPFNLVMFGAASSVVLSLIAQIGEQVDFLRFLPEPPAGRRLSWWVALTSAGPGWILIGAAKIAAGSFLAILVLRHNLPWDQATEPTAMYRVAFGYVAPSPDVSLLLVGLFVVVSQIKINVTNSYAGSIAWSNFFSRLTHSHPGRVVWLVFNVALALILMELGIFGAIGRILGLYSNFAVAWIGALVADLVINKPLKLSPPYTEFRRAHLYAFNPVGVGAMAISLTASSFAFFDAFGSTPQALAPFIGLVAAFAASPAIALATRGRYYIARPRDVDWSGQSEVQCCICTHKFEPEDMSHCPVYAGPICSLCCTLDARCHDSCKEASRFLDRVFLFMRATLPKGFANSVNSRLGSFLGVLLLFALMIGIVLMLVDFQYKSNIETVRDAVGAALSTVFFALLMICGVLAWLFVLAQESRRVAEEESARQTTILTEEIEAHKRTDAKLQKAKEAAEAANLAKSRYVVSISHEIRAPLNSIFGYAQLLERSASVPGHHLDAVRVIRRGAQHLAYLIDGLLDVSKIEAGRLQLYRDEVRLGDLLDQIVDMFRLPAKTKAIALRYVRPDDLPPLVYADQSRLSQILINLLSNAIKYTDRGHVTLRVRYRNQIAVFEVEDSGIGVHCDDLERIFEPFERGRLRPAQAAPGIGLGLTTTKLLTEIMGGEISVVSETGKGSVFRVRLFLFEPVRAETAAAPERRIRGYRGKRIKVLVADDDAAQIAMMRELLTPLGFVMSSAQDGAACLERFEQHQPDLVLLDISMPLLDGWEVARRLRRSGRGKAVIFIISANVGERPPADENGALCDDFLLKPIEVQKLLERIKLLLRIEWIYEPGGVPGLALRAAAFRPGDERRRRRCCDRVRMAARAATARRAARARPDRSCRRDRRQAAGDRARGWPARRVRGAIADPGAGFRIEAVYGRPGKSALRCQIRRSVTSSSSSTTRPTP